MRKLVVIVALCAALPLAAQDQPQGSQPKPAPPPTLEKPGMAAPEPKSEKPAKPAASKQVNPDSGKTVEEIIARVNNEIITRSEYDKARQTAKRTSNPNARIAAPRNSCRARSRIARKIPCVTSSISP